MNPKITQLLDSTSKRFDEEFGVIQRGVISFPRHLSTETHKAFNLKSQLELLAAVRDLAEGMKQAEPDPYRDSFQKGYNTALTDLLTALSEGKEKV